jgi:CheY-like chemotaxis protein
MASKFELRRITDGGTRNSLGIGYKELGILCELLDRGDRKGADRKRVYTRWPYRHTAVRVTLRHPGGSEVELVLASRNISRGGVAFLHNGYVHKGSACTVQLPVADGPATPLTGVVTYCQHRHARLHEIGVRFDEPINIRKYLSQAIGSDLMTYERIDAQTLVGRVLLVEDSAIDQRIMQHHLRETRLTLTIKSTIEEALKEPLDSFDAVFLDWNLPDGTGSEVLRALRAKGTACPVCFITADSAGLIAEGLWNPPESWMLAKPFSATQLLQTMAEMLDDVKRAKKEFAQTGVEPSQREGIERCIEILESTKASGDIPAAVDACLDLSSKATVCGLRSIVDGADNVIPILADSTEPFEKQLTMIRELAKTAKGAIRAAA